MPVLPQDNHQPPIPQEPQPPNQAQPSCDEGHHVDMDIHEGHHGADYCDINMDRHLHQPSPQADIHMEFVSGKPCDVNGAFLPPGAPPPPEDIANDNWMPFHNCLEFETAEFLYKQNQMPASQIDWLLDLWASTLITDLYNVIDSSPFGDAPWQHFTVAYDGERLTDEDRPWMDDQYKVWFCNLHEVMCNMLTNPIYANEIDYHPYREYSTEAWDQVDEIAKDLSTLGSTFVPVILGSGETTVSVGTGNNEYYPLYASIGNIHNNVRQAYHNRVAIIVFLAMPKKHSFRNFHQQLFHSSLSKILNPLKLGMTTPEVTHFRDGHYWWVIYGLGPYIADYEEQVLLLILFYMCVANHNNLDEDALPSLIEEALLDDLWDDFGIVTQLVPFTNDFPRADIFQMILLDILHQLVKGAFKDHLVTWAQKIMDDIDRRITAVALFSGLQRFPQGHGFKQWMGDDSKALMKVYLPAIEGHVPQDIMHTFCTLLDFCYLVCCVIITEDTLLEINDALSHFHHYREIFKATGVIFHFSLPHQHSLTHYSQNILCFSITKNKHIEAQINKLGEEAVVAAAAAAPANRYRDRDRDPHPPGPVPPAPSLIDIDEDLNIDNGPMVLQVFVQLVKTPRGKKCAQSIPALANELNIPCLSDLLSCFLFQQLHPNNPCDTSDVPLTGCPLYLNKILVFNSAFDLSSTGGMHVEHIHTCPSWWNKSSCNDCVFINTDSSLPGIQGLEVACYQGKVYPCAVIHWFNKVSDTADKDTGMWIVHPGYRANNTPEHAIIHIDWHILG
ncbi:uncharacterized protein BJ212DRAFT_1446262 [Suillus subaureus]|uniref:Uncharacterized protein n=1 Tax=Suillus subaureus TaxID=48587 RepID=A0A9P7EE06_9AGAM|nr:uncharacterized protein BJ212DRAFT_1446262 [Suillus subaureus]KAG1819162.1 hypothetical protein BJ212DRAFT_1446262 [Suillus subaureus]